MSRNTPWAPHTCLQTHMCSLVKPENQKETRVKPGTLELWPSSGNSLHSCRGNQNTQSYRWAEDDHQLPSRIQTLCCDLIPNLQPIYHSRLRFMLKLNWQLIVVFLLTKPKSRWHLFQAWSIRLIVSGGAEVVYGAMYASWKWQNGNQG